MFCQMDPTDPRGPTVRPFEPVTLNVPLVQLNALAEFVVRLTLPTDSVPPASCTEPPGLMVSVCATFNAILEFRYNWGPMESKFPRGPTVRPLLPVTVNVPPHQFSALAGLVV